MLRQGFASAALGASKKLSGLGKPSCPQIKPTPEIVNW
jgi:hypothetical protein